MVEIYEAYAPDNDMTFVMKDELAENGQVIATECIGWYYGRPNKEDTDFFYGKLRAEF